MVTAVASCRILRVDFLVVGGYPARRCTRQGAVGTGGQMTNEDVPPNVPGGFLLWEKNSYGEGPDSANPVTSFISQFCFELLSYVTIRRYDPFGHARL